MLSEPFMQHALLAAMILTPMCALLGLFMTARGMAFFSDTVSHGALAGVALGFWFGLANPTLPLIFVSLMIAGGILWLRERTELLTDTIMALLLSGSVAVGVSIMSMLPKLRGELHRYLFGDILAIGAQDLWLAAALAVVTIALVFARLNQFTLLTLHEEMAHVCGIRVRLLNYIFVIVLTITVALTIRLLGILLVTSLLIIPPAAARNVSRNLRQHLIFSMALGLISGVSGVVLSYHLDPVPCGPTIVLCSILLFVLTMMAGAFQRSRWTPVSSL